ncbi:aminoglycoside adenylyltransferase domain-containing protein [Saccharopolyspora shandongensis]|uniref:aminoglycoside adenylyltransferase domain-containing protein n=1 Tax=Saccharopolyspora shandongensis TaxID=418495 RepID=UPI00343C289E
MLQHDLATAVTRYLATADRLLPGMITGFYVVGSAALGGWRPGRSDVDFIAVVDGNIGDREARRLRVLHVAGNATAAGRALRRADPAIPGTMNGAFVLKPDLSEPVTQIRPLASHSGWSFKHGRGFDVNPVMWKVLRESGIAVRGPAPGRLGLDPEPDRLRAWNLDQLNGHWRSWAEKSLSRKPPRKPLLPAHRVALAHVLGPPRLHCTIATGRVITKESAAEYALDTFAARWHPLIRSALAHRTDEPVPGGSPEPSELPRLAGEFTLELIADADHS